MACASERDFWGDFDYITRKRMTKMLFRAPCDRQEGYNANFQRSCVELQASPTPKWSHWPPCQRLVNLMRVSDARRYNGRFAVTRRRVTARCVVDLIRKNHSYIVLKPLSIVFINMGWPF